MAYGIIQALLIHLVRLRTWYISMLTCALLLLGLLFFMISPPMALREPVYVTIEKGTSLTGAAHLLQEAGLLRSPVVFRTLSVLLQVEGVQAGTYTFSEPQTAYTVLMRLSEGNTGAELIRVTLREGIWKSEISELLAKELSNFDEQEFARLTEEKEGYLFPDTYFFERMATARDVVEKLESNFEARSDWKRYMSENDSVDSVVILASILEAEAQTMEDKRIIAGILRKRISLSMPLQVDAAFVYEQHVRGYVPTAADLKNRTPYNTYRTKGFTPTPICNPGYDSLLAAVTPKESAYLYYLSDSDGAIHYAKTFAEHVANKKKYLK